jgi:hypothetical protein
MVASDDDAPSSTSAGPPTIVDTLAAMRISLAG